MPFTNRVIPPPSGMTTDRFTLRPITAADAEIDHAAVMESRDYLRSWEQTSWPEDDFTVAANRDDLTTLESRHADDIAYTYTVLDPTGTECLGCVYLMPHDAAFLTRAQITGLADGDRWEDVDAAVYFWVRRSRLAEGMDGELLAAVRAWLSDVWQLDRYVVVTNEQLAQQVALIESTDLTLRFHIDEPDKPGRYLAYA